jgi:DNA-directed RNA polymerase specialized sigma24 family protein
MYTADFLDPLDLEPVIAPEPSMLVELLRRVSAELARYRTSGLLSEKELRTVEALWIAGLSLREFARREGVAPQAIEDRIQRLRERAPRFWLWWRLKNRMRGRRCR